MRNSCEKTSRENECLLPKDVIVRGRKNWTETVLDANAVFNKKRGILLLGSNIDAAAFARRIEQYLEKSGQRKECFRADRIGFYTDGRNIILYFRDREKKKFVPLRLGLKVERKTKKAVSRRRRIKSQDEIMEKIEKPIIQIEKQTKYTVRLKFNGKYLGIYYQSKKRGGGIKYWHTDMGPARAYKANKFKNFDEFYKKVLPGILNQAFSSKRPRLDKKTAERIYKEIGIIPNLSEEQNVEKIEVKNRNTEYKEAYGKEFYKSLEFNEEGYDTVGTRNSRRRAFRESDVSNLEFEPNSTSIRNLNMLGKATRHAIGGTKIEQKYGEILRALRFKNITDKIEKRYNLPAGLLLSMCIQEASGEDLKPNGANDGGAGLAHVQPRIAKYYGLKILDNAKGMVNKAHGRKIRRLLQEDPNRLFKNDDRFHRVKLLDMVARYVSESLSYKRRGGGPLRSAMRWYSGRSEYWKEIKKNMKSLHDPALMKKIEKEFNTKNPNLEIGGQKIKKGMQFQEYLNYFWRDNVEGFNLKSYPETPAYEPKGTDKILKTYKKLIK